MEVITYNDEQDKEDLNEISEKTKVQAISTARGLDRSASHGGRTTLFNQPTFHNNTQKIKRARRRHKFIFVCSTLSSSSSS
ncbi:unnamed protein product [Dovyalis caffra]|uniref:Uncharacterized protein n=1 Tax=Dovyalis caffra TaxID=77055 RepID=A0AAV1RZ22_9ROSI|nr:unnamed protein product [Dovyalis caffra]